MSTVLSRVIFPKREQFAQAELYFRGNIQAAEKGITVRKGDSARFDTYFNAFFYTKYLTYTSVSTVELRLKVTGAAEVRLLCTDAAGDESSLYAGSCTGDCVLPPVKLAELPAGGMLFFELSAPEGDVCLLGGQYETEEPPANRVKAAAVICTFHREEYVLRNLEQLRRTVWGEPDCPIKDDLDVFVVDNGRTLTLEDEAHVKLFPNLNYGGSGGFTRGLIEAYRRKGEYSHVLFMDDDISFETEALVKTLQLLKYAKAFERPLFVGGQMLIEDRPTVQFEAGAFYRNGRVSPIDHGLDLAGREGLLKNEAPHDAHYNGWWYCCFPLNVVDQAGLPLPFFIKADDMEYGLRCKPYILHVNGIGVWHTDFSRKYSVHLDYYIKRNELVVSAVHDMAAGIIPSLRKLIMASGRAALTGDPRSIGFMLQAYRDFLKGPDFFLTADEEQLNSRLLEERKRPAKPRPISILTDPFRLLPVIAQVAVRYEKARRQYRDRLGELTGLDFWDRHLGLEKQK